MFNLFLIDADAQCTRMSTSTLAVSPCGVLVASSDALFRRYVVNTLNSDRWPVREALGGADALGKLESGSCHLLVLDRRLPDLDADELAHMIEVRFPGIEVVVLDPDTGRPTVRTTASAAMSPLLRALEKAERDPGATRPAGAIPPFV